MRKLQNPHLEMRRDFYLPTYKNLLFRQTLVNFKFFHILTYIHLSCRPSRVAAICQQNNSCRHRSTGPPWQHVYVKLLLDVS
jgi:hypothetical protein